MPVVDPPFAERLHGRISVGRRAEDGSRPSQVALQHVRPGQAAGHELRPESRADVAGEGQRLFEVSPSDRQCEQVEMDLAERAARAGDPLAVFDLLGDDKAALRGLQGSAVLAPETEDRP